MKTAIEQGLHASPWTDNRAGAHVIRAAKNILQGQVEAGHGCPITMTFAAVPSIRLQPDLAKTWLPLITSRIYDPRNVPIDQKQGVTIGMGMTEKQGGSDVRANTTKAYAVAAEGGGQLYKIVGHKFFLSAPVRIYKGIDKISTPINNINKLLKDVKILAPHNIKKNKA